MKGIAYLVGTGPGDPGLVTLRARELIEQADVLIYDYLCNPEILRWARPEAEKLYAGKQGGLHTLPQEEINARLVEYVQSGRMVVRLKGGDPFVFGRGGEEAQEIVRAGLDFEVVPGVSSAIAAPAYAGIPVTHRDIASSVTFITGHEYPVKPAPNLDWKALASETGTKVILMGVQRLRIICEELLRNGASPETPCALVRWGTYPRQQTLIATVSSLADLAEAQQFQSPAVLIIGEVVKLRQELNWFEKKPLFGRRIVVTRAQKQASTLAQQLTRLGAEVLEIPTIRIQPRNWTQGVAVNDVANQFDWLVFTSANAVEYFLQGFFAITADLRLLGSVKIAAVGPATADKIRLWKLPVNLLPAKFTAKDLAANWSPQEIRDQRFLLLRGNLASTELPLHLKAYEGKVTEWTLYDTLPETEDLWGTRSRLKEEGADWITFTSSSSVENWHRLSLPTGPIPTQTRYASIGSVTTETMRRLGYPVDAEAGESTIDGLVRAILRES